MNGKKLLNNIMYEPSRFQQHNKKNESPAINYSNELIK